jgi:RimJ/RimL family protein N-acetyltransferase
MSLVGLFRAPVTLTGRHAELVPLAPGHHDALCAAASDGDLWNLWYTNIPRPEGMRADIERKLAQQAEGSMLPFAVRNLHSGKISGVTTYMNIDAARQRLEIGSTWYAKSVQRTPLNTECKLLLIAHAFEQAGCIAVEFRTSFFNHASRNAIARLGAKQDGILRSHQIAPNGTLRDTVVYSIIASEWPTVKAHLNYQLNEKPRA